MAPKPISVSSVCGFPSQPWMQNWVVNLMLGAYPAWEKGTTPQEVRTFSQQIGSAVHVMIQKELGFAVSPKLLNAANRAILDEEISQKAYHSLDLWHTW